jgi:hypothetical protein
MEKEILLFGEFFSPTEWAAVGTISSAVYTLLTLGLFAVSLFSLKKSNKLSEFQIYQKISEMLSTEVALDLIQKCKNKTLTLNTDSEKQKFKKELLNPLEDLAKFRKDKLISIDGVYSGFSAMLLYVCNNDEVQRYVNEARGDGISSLVYGGLGDLYSEVYNYCDPEEVTGLKSSLFKIAPKQSIWIKFRKRFDSINKKK